MEDRKTIHDRMLKNISDEFDKSEGSFFYDATKPAAIEFERKNKEIQEVANKLDVENLEGEELERFVYQRTGQERKPATKATTIVIITGQEGAKISKSDLVGSDTVNFVSTEDKTVDATGRIEVLVECELAGSVGNVPAGAIKYFPVSIAGLTSVTNQEAVTNGYDAESDESLLERYYERIRTPATSGNKYHYKNWAKEVTGVGDAKVLPRWKADKTIATVKSILDTILLNGTYTNEQVQNIINKAIECALGIKVVVIDANKNPATDELVVKVYEHIEEERPIGPTVTVVSAISKNISITAKVRLAEGYRIQLVQDEFKKMLEQYRKDVAFKDSYISYAAIGNILFAVDGVLDYTDLKLNNAMKNIALGEEEIPIFADVELEVI